jgi:hypothetical protein
MAIKKYYADKNNTITNAFRANLQTRGTGANMGLSDVLETFSIYAQQSSGSTELERILIEFPVSQITTDRASNIIPASGSVSFYLNMYNARSNQTLPRELNLVVLPISQSWQEGTGLDMEEYKDVTKGNVGSNWINAGQGDPWTREGGDYLTSSYSQIFPIGNEDLEIDITPLVEDWIAGTITNYGIGVHLTSSQEAYFSSSADTGSQLINLVGATETYYTKKFFGRGTEFFFSKPTIQARWDSSIKDDRGNFYASSSLVPAVDNTRTLYLYNVIGGRLRNIPAVGTGEIYVKVYTSASAGVDLTPTVITGGYDSLGIYSASFVLDTTASTVYDRWYSSGLTSVYHTGTFDVKQYAASTHNPYGNLVTALTNLRSVYTTSETARFRFYEREKDWSPTIYTVATTVTDTLVNESASYQVHRIIDDLVVIPYNTGSDRGTQMSFDVSGNYFDLEIDLLEPGYSYGIKIAYYNETVNSYVEQSHEWKFRVEEV